MAAGTRRATAGCGRSGWTSVPTPPRTPGETHTSSPSPTTPSTLWSAWRYFIFHIHGAPIDYYRYTRYGLEYLFRDFADLRVQPQHSGYMSLVVTVGRLIAEEAAIFRILALPLSVLVNLLALLDPLMRRVLPIEGLTTGYFVSCRK